MKILIPPHFDIIDPDPNTIWFNLKERAIPDPISWGQGLVICN